MTSADDEVADVVTVDRAARLVNSYPGFLEVALLACTAFPMAGCGTPFLRPCAACEAKGDIEPKILSQYIVFTLQLGPRIREKRP